MAILPVEVSVKGINQVDQLNRKLGTLEKQGTKTQSATDKLSKNLTRLGSAALAYIAIDRLASSVVNLGKSFVSTADSMSLINSRLSLVTSSSKELATVQTQLLSISNEARVGISGTSDLYAQLARSTQSLGLESSYLLDVTRTISQTLTISGASAQSANASLFQLSQGLSAGALRGEELNSVLEQTPRLAQAIADGMGVSIGQLRQLGSEGALTAEKVLGALKTQAEAVNAEFAGIAVTAQSGYTVLQNNITSVIGKLDQQHKITQTIGKTFVALSETVDTLLITAFEELTGESGDFGEVTVSAIGGIIGAGGNLYDLFESIGDVFNVIGSTGETAFWGIQVVSSTVSRSIQQNFQDVLNGIIDGYNSIASYVGLPTLGRLDFGVEQLRAREDYARTQFSEASANLAANAEDLANISTVGRDTASAMIESFSTEFAELMSEQANETERQSVDYAEALEKFNTTTEDTTTSVENLTENNEELKSTIQDLLNSTSDTVDTFDDVVTVTDDLNNTYTVTTTKTSDLNDTLEETVTSIEILTASFTDTFIGSLQRNIESLNSLASNSAFNSTTYTKALLDAQSARDNLIANPLDVEIGQQYTDAYNAFISSASSYIQDTSQFASREQLLFAQSTIRTQSGQLQATATEAATVLDGIKELTELINTSFADGILTDEEKSTIAGVADSVNTKNESLLGTNGQLAGVINGQVYFDNSDVVDTIGSQTYYDNKDIVGAVGGINLDTSPIVTALDTLELSGGEVNIDTSSIVNATNSVTSAVNQMAGAKSIADLLNVSDTIATVTGLTKNEIVAVKGNTSSLSSIDTNTDNIDKNTKEYNIKRQEEDIRSYGSSVWLGNTKYTGSVKTEDYTYTSRPPSGSGALKRKYTYITPYNNNGVLRWDERVSYDYYADGGFTGKSNALPDSTGQKPAGIVHEDEWVAPKWMLNQNPSLFNSLEAVRQKGSFATGGYTGARTVSNSTNQSDQILMSILNKIDSMDNILRRVTENGESMNVVLQG